MTDVTRPLKYLPGTCAYCGKTRCDRKFYDRNLKDWDIAHKRCIPKPKDDPIGKAIVRLFAESPLDG